MLYNKMILNKKAKVRFLLIFFIIVCFLGFGVASYFIFDDYITLSGDSEDDTNLNLSNNITIQISNAEWKVTHASGIEGQLIFWTSNKSDKKTELGWLLPDDDKCKDWEDLSTYDKNKNKIKDDKNKDLKIKCKQNACDGQSCFYIKLKDMEAINIDDFIKLGENSIITEYVNYINYQFDTGNVTLNLMNKDLPLNMNNLTINFDDDVLKFGAYDNTVTNESELHNYVYTLNSTNKIRRFRNGIEVYDNKYCDGYLCGEKHYFDFDDVCSREFNPHEVIYQECRINTEIKDCLNETYYINHTTECLICENKTRIETTKADCRFEVSDKIATINFVSNKNIDPTVEWWSGSYDYRKQINVSNDTIDSNLTDFPVLINFTDSDINDHALATGYDIRFADSNDYELPYEREIYSSGSGIFWVKTNVTAASVTSIYIYYGNNTIDAGADGEDSINVWDGGYKAVYHMNNLSVNDSTSNVNNLRGVGVSVINGQVGNAIEMASSNKGFASEDIGPYLETPKNFTFEAWVYLNNSQEHGFFDLGYEIAGTDMGLAIWINDDEQISLGAGGILDNAVISSNTNAIPLKQWAHVMIIRNRTNISFYVDGSYEGSGTVGSGDVIWASNFDTANWQERYIGHRYEERVGYGQDGPAYFNGSIDEFAIWNHTLDSTAIASRYNSGSGSQLTGTENGLIAVYHFNENSYSGTRDEVRDLVWGINGIGTNGILSVSGGKLGRAAKFDGTDDYIDDLGIIDVITNTDFTDNNWTIVYLAKPYDTDGGIIWDNRYDIAGADSGYAVGFATSSDKKLLADLNGDSDNLVDTSPNNAYNVNEWGVFTITRNSTNDFSYFVDDSYFGGDSAGVTDIVYESYATWHSVGRVGNSYVSTCGVPVKYFSGSVDELRIYDGVLSNDYIKFMSFNIKSTDHELTFGDEEGEEPSENTCTCPSVDTDWEVDMEDCCNLTTPCNLGTGNLTWIGSFGYFNCSSVLNLSNRNAPLSSTIFYYSKNCEVNRV